MLTEKRYEVILKCLNEKNSITVTELKELLGISESTIRRDLTALDKAGKLVKVFGGAVAVDSGFTTVEPSVAQKSGVNKEEKSSTTYKKYETGIEDTYGEGEGRVYESDEDPLDLYSQVEGKIEIKIR